MDVTVVGTSGTTVTIPFTSAENSVFAQFGAGGAISALPDASKFVASGTAATTTSARGVISTLNGATITDTAAGASVVAGGANFTYTASGTGQTVAFSASGTGNLLANGGAVATTYYVDAGGNAGHPGTTVNAASGSAVVNAGAGYLDVVSGAGGVVLNDWGANVTISGGAATVGGSGAVTLAGGSFLVAPYSPAGSGAAATIPALTATGSDLINSGTALKVNLVDGAAVTVQNFPFVLLYDTVVAAGGGTVFANGANAVVSQTGAGNLFFQEAAGGIVTAVNAFAGATETLAASTVFSDAQALVYNLNGGDFDIIGARPTVNAAGSDTVSFTGTDAIILTEAANARVDLAGGRVYVAGIGSGSSVTFSGADTVTFASTAIAASVLGAGSAVTLPTGSGQVLNTTTAIGGTELITGTTSNADNYYIVDPGTTNNVMYFGTVYRTGWDGVPVETYSGTFTANNVVVWGGSGSQTVFGGGDAFGYGVVNTEYGGTAGNNLLVGAGAIYGGGAGDTLQAGAFTTYMKAASAGNTTLIGGDGSFNGAVNFAAANETLIGSSAADAFIFGTGTESITGGAGADRFIDINRAASGTTITINDFVSGTDKVDLFSVTNAAGTGATANVTGQTHSGGNTYVTLSDGVTINFQGVGSVTASDFGTNYGTIQVGKIA